MIARLLGKLIVLSCLTLMLCAPAWSQTYIQEDFDDGNVDNWRVINGDWVAQNGEYVSTNADGEAKSTIADGVWDTAWGGNYTVEARWMYEQVGTAGLLLRMQNPNAAVAYSCNTSEGALGFHLKSEAAPWTKHIIVPMTVEANRWYEVKAQCLGDTITIYLDGEEKGVYVGAELLEGPMGIKSLNTPNVHYDDILVYGPDGPDSETAVKSVGKLSTTWAEIKK